MCRADRKIGNGACGMKETVKVARASVHMWEEPPISGDNGSGTVFFSGCPLKCVYCQNYRISHDNIGKEITVERLAEIMKELEAKKVHNINLVSPTQFVPQIKAAVASAKASGMSLPVVYNTSGYERAETVSGLSETVDIYLTDFRYMTPYYSMKYSGVSDYPDAAKAALKEMVRTAGPPVLDDNGIMRSGVIVRVLVLPGLVREAMEITDYVYGTYGDSVYISLMNQYTPTENINADLFPELRRKVSREEYDEVVEHAENIGVEYGFVQDGGTADESFIPEFDFSGV